MRLTRSELNRLEKLSANSWMFLPSRSQLAIYNLEKAGLVESALLLKSLNNANGTRQFSLAYRLTKAGVAAVEAANIINAN